MGQQGFIVGDWNGNTSLTGALDEIARAAHNMEVIELNMDPQVEDRYIDRLHLPE